MGWKLFFRKEVFMAPAMLICEREDRERCVGCGERVRGEKSVAELCDKCARKFKDHCPICGKFFTRGIVAPLCRRCARELEGTCFMCDKGV